MPVPKMTSTVGRGRYVQCFKLYTPSSRRIGSSSNQIRRDVFESHRLGQAAHHHTQMQIEKGNKEIIDNISSKLEDMCRSVPQAPSVARSNRVVHFAGAHREAILTPLLLVREQLQRSLLETVSHSIELQRDRDNDSEQSESAACCA